MISFEGFLLLLEFVDTINLDCFLLVKSSGSLAPSSKENFIRKTLVKDEETFILPQTLSIDKVRYL